MRISIHACLALFLGILMVSCTSRRGVSGATGIPLQTHTFAQLDRLLADAPRPVAVFLHAEWCRYCRSMDRTTLRDEAVVRLLNERYYYLPFDGEQEAPVFIRAQVFRYRPSGRGTGTHELAGALGTVDGRLVYPTFVLLNAELEIVFQYPGYLDAPALREVLEQGAENH